MNLLCILLSCVVLAHSQTVTSRYYAYDANGCDPGDTQCPDAIPNTGGLKAWDISNFGGPSSERQETDSDIRDDEASQWFMATDFRLEPGYNNPPSTSTIRGIKFTVTFENRDLVLKAGSFRILIPNGTMAVPTEPHPAADYSFPDLPNPEPRNIPTGAAENSDLWSLDGVGLLSENPLFFEDTNYGIAFYVSGGSGRRRARVYSIRMEVYWTAQGQTTGPTTGVVLPTTTTGGGGSGTTTVPNDDRSGEVSIGVVVGAAIGGLLLLAGIVLLIIYLVRRQKMSQPSIRLDAPLTAYESF